MKKNVKIMMILFVILSILLFTAMIFAATPAAYQIFGIASILCAAVAYIIYANQKTNNNK